MKLSPQLLAANARRNARYQAEGRSSYRANQRFQNMKTLLKKNEPRCSDHASPWYQLEVLSRNDVAELLGVTPRAVGLIERKAIWKIRKALTEHLKHDRD